MQLAEDVARLFGGVTHAGKLGDIGAGGKGRVAVTAYDNAAQAFVGGQLLKDCGELAPHCHAERVQLARVAQRDGGDVTVTRVLDTR